MRCRWPALVVGAAWHVEPGPFDVRSITYLPAAPRRRGQITIVLTNPSARPALTLSSPLDDRIAVAVPRLAGAVHAPAADERGSGRSARWSPTRLIRSTFRRRLECPAAQSSRPPASPSPRVIARRSAPEGPAAHGAPTPRRPSIAGYRPGDDRRRSTGRRRPYRSSGGSTPMRRSNAERRSTPGRPGGMRWPEQAVEVVASAVAVTARCLHPGDRPDRHDVGGRDAAAGRPISCRWRSTRRRGPTAPTPADGHRHHQRAAPRGGRGTTSHCRTCDASPVVIAEIAGTRPTRACVDEGGRWCRHLSEFPAWDAGEAPTGGWDRAGPRPWRRSSRDDVRDLLRAAEWSSRIASTMPGRSPLSDAGTESPAGGTQRRPGRSSWRGWRCSSARYRPSRAPERSGEPFVTVAVVDDTRRRRPEHADRAVPARVSAPVVGGG